jgi:hypothetical protein
LEIKSNGEDADAGNGPYDVSKTHWKWITAVRSDSKVIAGT